MCVALPGIVEATEKNIAVVNFSGNRVKAASGLVDVKAGDRVLVHAGMILQKVSLTEAEEMEKLFSEIGEI